MLSRSTGGGLLLLAALAAGPALAQQAGPVPPLSGVIVPPLYGQPPVQQRRVVKPVRQPRPRQLPLCVERQGVGGSRLVCSKPVRAR